MNAIRKQVSGIKGERLAAATHPARVVSLIVLDIPGDHPWQVASGSTVPDATTRAGARKLACDWRIDLPPAVTRWLSGEAGIAPDPADKVAVAALAEARGIPAVMLSGGETTNVILRGSGKGGRNTEFLLALAMVAETVPFAALAVGTDGIDGSEDNAGTFADGESMARLRA